MELLKNQHTKDSFKLELSNRFATLRELPEDAGVEQLSEGAKTMWIQACEKALERRTRQHKEWISPETLKKIEERRIKKAVLNNSKTRATKAEHL